MMFFPWHRVWRSKTVWFSALVLVAFGLVATLAPWLAPHDPFRLEITQARLPPMWVHTASSAGLAAYPLGTDLYGRDILSRLLYGTRTAFFLALTAVPVAALAGTLVGLLAGYAGGRAEALIMFAADVSQSLPGIMVVVGVVLLLRNLLDPTWLNGLVTLVIGFVLVSWAGLARLIRLNVQMLKSQLFVEAARALGASPWHILTRHLLPNVLHVVVVWVITNIPAVILLEAVLGYIGVGMTNAAESTEFTVISWGGMFYSGRAALSRNPLMIAIPSLGILLLSMSFILLGDFLTGITGAEGGGALLEAPTRFSKSRGGQT